MSHILIRADILTLPECYVMSPIEKLIYQQIIYRCQSSQLGIFMSHRDHIASDLRLDSAKYVEDFLEKYQNLVYFDPSDHIFWVKKYYNYISFGLDGEVVILRSKKNGAKEFVKNSACRNNINLFIDKIKKEWKKPELKFKLDLKKSWVKQNFSFLDEIHTKAIQFEKNNRSLEEFFLLLEDEKLLTGLLTVSLTEKIGSETK